MNTGEMPEPLKCKVIVCTVEKLHDSISTFNQELTENDNNVKIALFALTQFLVHSDEANPLTRSDIYCFSLPKLAKQIELWAKYEVSRYPHQKDRITTTTRMILDLFDSMWAFDNSLLVQELLTPETTYKDFP